MGTKADRMLTFAAVLIVVMGLIGNAKGDFTFGEPVNLGPTINSEALEYSHCLSADGLELYFGSNREGGHGSVDIWVSIRATTEDEWGPPENLGSIVNSSNGDLGVSLSTDGLELYFQSLRSNGLGSDDDIWVTKRAARGEPWGEPVNLGPTVNSELDEYNPCLSADGLELYFVFGEWDPQDGAAHLSLCTTKRETKDDPWGESVNLGPVVNDWPYQDTPWISSDNCLLMFTDIWKFEPRLDGFGNTDIWFCQRANQDDEWNKPMNLGPAINTVFAEDFPMISTDGSTIYFNSDRSGGFGSQDLWQAPILPVVDFDDDGIVGFNDLTLMVESWGTDNPRCDIGPMPWGDGVVDDVDLEILMGYWGQMVYYPYDPRRASNPEPTDGSKIDVNTSLSLSWTPGRDAGVHDVYFGEDSVSVEQADITDRTGVYRGRQDISEYTTTELLTFGQTLFWRIDEVYSDGTVIKGQLWSFTTNPEIAVKDPDLLGWWTMDEGVGKTAIDWSGHGGHGSFVGEPQWVNGYQGMALEFSGGEFINCGDNAAGGVTDDFTIAAWVKMNPGNTGAYMGIAGKLSVRGNPQIYTGFALVRHSSNVFRLWVGDDTENLAKSRVNSDITYTDVDWHHVAGVREGQINSLYVDGVKQTASSTTPFVPSDLFFHIGKQYSNTNERYFKGKIDDVRVYNRALTDSQIIEVMGGDLKQAHYPEPGNDALLDIRNISALSWTAGDGAVLHDVYFGQDKAAIAGADNSAPEFQGNQSGTSLSLAGLIEFGGGDYYWRVDEVATDGVVTTGTIWKFTVPEYLIVDNFERYTDDVDPMTYQGPAIWNTWIDAFLDWSNGGIVGYITEPFAETIVVHSGFQAMPFFYDNDGTLFEGEEDEVTNVPYYSETHRTWAEPQDWTSNGVEIMTLWLYGEPDNAAEPFYVGLEDSAGNRKDITHPDPALLTVNDWQQWHIRLADFTDVDLTAIMIMYIGVGDPAGNQPGGAGLVRIDDIELHRPSGQ